MSARSSGAKDASAGAPGGVQRSTVSTGPSQRAVTASAAAFVPPVGLKMIWAYFMVVPPLCKI